MAAILRWSVRLFALIAMVAFAALAVVFVIVTVDHFGQKEYVTDRVGGLPPVYVITALLVPFCAAFVAGFWMLFLDSFRDETEDEQAPAGTPERPPLRQRVAAWAKVHRPHWPRRAQ